MSHPNPQIAEAAQVMIACGLSPKAIAKELGITETTLTTFYQEDLDHGLELANAKVAKVFFDMATSGEHPTLTAKWMELRSPDFRSNSSLTINDTREEAEIAREKLLRLINRASPSPPQAILHKVK